MTAITFRTFITQSQRNEHLNEINNLIYGYNYFEI
jgi:hypothetical protein